MKEIIECECGQRPDGTSCFDGGGNVTLLPPLPKWALEKDHKHEFKLSFVVTT